MIDHSAKSNQFMENADPVKDLFIKVIEVYRYLINYWKIILLMGTIGAVLGLAYSFTKISLYKAQYTFALEDEKSGGIGGALGLASQLGFSVGGSGGGAFSGDNLIELMRSRSLVEKALLSPIVINGKNKSLIDHYIDFNGLQESWSKKPEYRNLSFAINADASKFTKIQNGVIMSIHQTLISDFLSVTKVDKKLSIIKVELKSKDELFAKNFTEALIDEVSKFYIQTKTKKSYENVAILQHQTDSIRQQLNNAISGVAQSSDNTLNLNAARQVLRIPSQQRQVDVQANSAILTELVKNLELSKLSLRKETPLIQVIDKPILPLPIERVSRIRSLVIGAFLAGFITVTYFLIRRYIINLFRN